MKPILRFAVVTTLTLSTVLAADLPQPLISLGFDDGGEEMISKGSTKLKLRLKRPEAFEGGNLAGQGVAGAAFNNSEATKMGGGGTGAALLSDFSQSIPQLGGGFTITGWFKSDSIPQNGARLVEIGLKANGGTALWLAFPGDKPGALRARCVQIDPKADSSATSSSAASNPGEWSFFAVAFSPSEQKVCFFNGDTKNPAAATGESSLLVPKDWNGPVKLMVGNSSRDGVSGFDTPFQGLLDEIAIYPGVLDASQIEAVRALAAP